MQVKMWNLTLLFTFIFEKQKNKICVSLNFIANLASRSISSLVWIFGLDNFH